MQLSFYARIDNASNIRVEVHGIWISNNGNIVSSTILAQKLIDSCGVIPPKCAHSVPLEQTHLYFTAKNKHCYSLIVLCGFFCRLAADDTSISSSNFRLQTGVNGSASEVFPTAYFCRTFFGTRSP